MTYSPEEQPTPESIKHNAYKLSNTLTTMRKMFEQKETRPPFLMKDKEKFSGGMEFSNGNSSMDKLLAGLRNLYTFQDEENLPLIDPTIFNQALKRLSANLHKELDKEKKDESTNILYKQSLENSISWVHGIQELIPKQGILQKEQSIHGPIKEEDSSPNKPLSPDVEERMRNDFELFKENVAKFYNAFSTNIEAIRKLKEDSLAPLNDEAHPFNKLLEQLNTLSKSESFLFPPLVEKETLDEGITAYRKALKEEKKAAKSASPPNTELAEKCNASYNSARDLKDAMHKAGIVDETPVILKETNAPLNPEAVLAENTTEFRAKNNVRGPLGSAPGNAREEGSQPPFRR